jgi:hypothetical protein
MPVGSGARARRCALLRPASPPESVLRTGARRLQVFDPHGPLGPDDSGMAELATIGRGGFGWVDAEAALLGCAEVRAAGGGGWRRLAIDSVHARC